MAMSLVVFIALLAPAFAGWSNTEVESITTCTTQYGPVKNITQSTETWVLTDTYTTTAWTNLMKTEVRTLKPSTTTLLVTSTSTSYFYPGDSMTTTLYTSTYYDLSTVTQTETVSSTTTVTVSEVETLTVPTLAGFVPLATASPGAAKKINSWEDSGDWDVEDVYWTPEPAATDYGPIYIQPILAPTIEVPLPTGILWRRHDAQSSQQLKVDCTLTVVSNNFYSTNTIKQSGPRATFTRTSIVATETSTFTVHTKPTTTPASTVYTYEDTYWAVNTTYTTATVTAVETATETVYPSTTSVQAACATGNIIDSYNGYWLRAPGSWFPDPAANYTKQQFWSWDTDAVSSADECCARAVVDPKTIFWRYSGWGDGCEIWKGGEQRCAAGGGWNGTSGSKIGVEVFYEPIGDQGYWSSFDVGNGACGSVGFESLWE